MDDSPDWQGMADEIGEWLATERQSGRHAALTAPSALHKLLVVADSLGLPSNQASIELEEEPLPWRAVCRWPAKSICMTVRWDDPWAERPASPDALVRVLDPMLQEAQGPEDTHVVVTFSTTPTSASLQALFADAPRTILGSDDLKSARIPIEAAGMTTTLQLLAGGNMTSILRAR